MNALKKLSFYQLLVVALLIALVWTQRKSFAKVRPGAGGCGGEDTSVEDGRAAAAAARSRRR